MQILKINPEKKNIDSFVATDFEFIGYDPHEKIEMKMAVWGSLKFLAESSKFFFN